MCACGGVVEIGILGVLFGACVGLVRKLRKK